MITFITFFLPCISTALWSIFSGAINRWADFYLVILFYIANVLALAVLIIIGLYIASLFMKINAKKDEPGGKYSKVARFMTNEYLGFMCFIGRIKIVLTGKEKLPDGRFLLVSNHRSNFDAIVTDVALKDKEIAWVSKQSLLKLPIVGEFMYYSGFLAMNREDVRQSLKTINAAADFIKNDVLSVGICPEGTRNTTSELLLPFKTGSLKIAQKAKCPIVVMTVENTECIKNRFPFRRTVVYVDILKTFTAEEASANSIDLSEEIASIMRENLSDKKGKKVYGAAKNALAQSETN